MLGWAGLLQASLTAMQKSHSLDASYSIQQQTDILNPPYRHLDQQNVCKMEYRTLGPRPEQVFILWVWGCCLALSAETHPCAGTLGE